MTAPTSFLDLSEDILGKIYDQCTSAADRRAFRTFCLSCYDSPNICSRVNSLPKWMAQGIDFMTALSSFPRAARLTNIHIYHFTYPVLESLVTQKMDTEEGRRARAKLAGVRHVTLVCTESEVVLLFFSNLSTKPDRKPDASCAAFSIYI